MRESNIHDVGNLQEARPPYNENKIQNLLPTSKISRGVILLSIYSPSLYLVLVGLLSNQSVVNHFPPTSRIVTMIDILELNYNAIPFYNRRPQF